MNSQNFIAFFIVQGFLFGVVFGVLNANAPEGILLYTLVTLLFFYGVAHFSASFFISFDPIKEQLVYKSEYEHMLDRYADEIHKREVLAEKTFNYFKSLDEEQGKHGDVT